MALPSRAARVSSVTARRASVAGAGRKASTSRRRRARSRRVDAGQIAQGGGATGDVVTRGSPSGPGAPRSVTDAAFANLQHHLEQMRTRCRQQRHGQTQRAVPFAAMQRPTSRQTATGAAWKEQRRLVAPGGLALVEIIKWHE